MDGTLPRGAELRRLGHELRGRRAEAETQRGALERSLAELQRLRETDTADDEHDPEGPTTSAEWSRLAGLTREREAELATLDRALSRLENGGYGACLRCGQPIGLARLEARPAAELCIDCGRRTTR